MRKVVLTLALSAAFGIAHAESGDNQLFDCMDAKTFEMNNQCMSDKIGNNIRFRDAQAKLIDIASDRSRKYAHRHRST